MAIDAICKLNWAGLGVDELTDAAWGYYYFSVQFRENLEIARQLFPDDIGLRQLAREECDTSNLSPWSGVAAAGERMNHDEFMRRSLSLCQIQDERRLRLQAIGQAYLRKVRAMPLVTRALSIASYEDGGLERVFRAILTARSWHGRLLQAFQHFLVQHIKFDSDPEQGHGALSRHLLPGDQVLPLWIAFRDNLVECVPDLELAPAPTG